MYSPQLGRFVSRDPVGLTPGTNIYQYVGGSPINFIDPSGRFRVDPEQHYEVFPGYWYDGNSSPYTEWLNETPVLDTPSEGFWQGEFGGGGSARFGRDALQYIGDNLDFSSLTKAALTGLDCLKGVPTTGKYSKRQPINPKKGMVVTPPANGTSIPYGFTNLVGMTLGVSYTANCDTIVTAADSNGCCLASVYCDIEADVVEYYTFKGKGWFPGQKPYKITGHISTYRRRERLICGCRSLMPNGYTSSRPNNSQPSHDPPYSGQRQLP